MNACSERQTSIPYRMFVSSEMHLLPPQFCLNVSFHFLKLSRILLVKHLFEPPLNDLEGAGGEGGGRGDRDGEDM